MALPKYKEVKAIIEKSVSKRFRDIARAEMRPFNESPNFIQREGKTLIHNTLDNQEAQKTMIYQMAKVEYKLEHSKIPDMAPEEVFAIIDEKAKEMGRQMAKYHFEVLNKTIKEAGNSVDVKGQKLSPDLFLKAMSNVSIAFDKEGNPKLPTIVISPKAANQWKRIFAEAEADPKHKEKFDAIIAQKKKEFDAEQARRKLVD